MPSTTTCTTSRTPAFVRWEKIPRQVRPLGPSTHLDLTQNTSAARSRETKTKEDDGGIGTTARSCTVRIPPLRSLNRNLVFFKWEWDSETIAVVDTKDWNESLVATVLRWFQYSLHHFLCKKSHRKCNRLKGLDALDRCFPEVSDSPSALTLSCSSQY